MIDIRRPVRCPQASPQPVSWASLSPWSSDGGLRTVF